MRRIYTLLAAFALLAAGQLHANDSISYLNAIGVDGLDVVKNKREVTVKMNVNLSEMHLRPQHTVALFPVLVSADGTHEHKLQPVVIDGRTRNKVYLRAQKLKSVALPPYHAADEAYTILPRKNGKEQTLEYTATLPYERWMLGSRVELREEVHGCVNCQKGQGLRALDGTFMPAFYPEYKVSSFAPQYEIKVREKSAVARIQFKQDRYEILRNYKNNRAELDTVINSIAGVQGKPDITITGIFITGYASPEGSVPHNIKLTENRARSLAKYIHEHNHIDNALLNIDWKGEDWKGFREELDNFPGLERRDEVIAIVDGCTGDRDECEKLIKKLQPPTIYTYLMNNLYPRLRRNEYRIEYNVRNFSLEEARRIIRTDPELLSLYEVYLVKDSYEKGTDDYAHAWQTAVSLHGDSAVVLNDLAHEALNAKNYAEVVRVLKAKPALYHKTELLNTLGVAYIHLGEFERAKAVLRDAEEAGNADARHNLQQLDAYLDQQ